MAPDGFVVTPASRIRVSAESVDGRLRIAFGPADGPPVEICDVSNAPAGPFFRVLEPGSYVLYISAHDHGDTPYDVTVSLQVEDSGEEPVLVTRFVMSNPGPAADEVEGKDIPFTVRAT